MDYAKLLLALDLVVKAHEGQIRRGWEQYVHHPICVAQMVFKAGLGTDMVIAALLHDTVEDTWVSFEYLKSLDWISPRVLFLVEGMTKSEINGETSKEHLTRIVESEDKELIMLKLLDVSHNLLVRQQDYWPGMEDSLISYRARTKVLLAALKK